MADVTAETMAGSRSARRPAAIAAAPDSVNATVILIFTIACALPVSFHLGGLLLNPNRLLLLILSIPVMIRWLNGQAGRKHYADYMMLAYGIWMMLSVAANQGFQVMVSFGGSQNLDIVMAYFAGRAFVRSREDFMFLVKCYLGVLLCLLPFYIIESLSERAVLIEAFGAIPGLTVYELVDYELRLGMRRAQASFNHPILAGVFASSAFSLAWVCLRGNGTGPGAGAGKRKFYSAVSVVTTFFSLSSGAFLSVIVQVCCYAWDTILKNMKKRWVLFFSICAVTYLVLGLFTSHNPIITLTTRLAFSGHNAWIRAIIWEYGSAEVMRRPILGGGQMNDWIRPHWLPPSVDNHWLLVAMRYGLPALFMILTAYFYVCFKIITKDYKDDLGLRDIARGVTYTMAGTFVAFGTVAAWEGPYSMILFILGGACFLLRDDLELTSGTASSGPPDRTAIRTAIRPGPRYTRFPAEDRTAHQPGHQPGHQTGRQTAHQTGRTPGTSRNRRAPTTRS